MSTLNILVVPNASITEIVGMHDGALKIRLAAPPVDGKANEELIRFLAKKLDLAPSDISIDKGATGKRKRIDIPLPDEDVKTMLGL
ncbi:DUF167 domain-containing protein [Candidatus Uhrbacteria bacterium]|nr:DUF167 domain-containing protein [Candidatus Uhrbacteria bacterium]